MKNCVALVNTVEILAITASMMKDKSYKLKYLQEPGFQSNLKQVMWKKDKLACEENGG